MQGHLSGVQKRVKDEHCPFALNLHCLNHQLQLSVKWMNTGHNLVNRITDNCKIIVKLIRYSPKRGAALEVVKNRIRDCRGHVPSWYTSLSKKVLQFCVTRWTVRASSLLSIDSNHLSIMSLFAVTMLNKEDKNGLNEERNVR